MVTVDEVAKRIRVKDVSDPTTGKQMIFVFLDNELRAYLEIQPLGDFVHRYFFMGFTIDGKPFMESGVAEGEYYEVYELDERDFAEMLMKGRYSEDAIRRKVYRAKPSTIKEKIRKLRETYLCSQEEN